MWPGLPGKTPFPKDWTADRIIREISDIAADPNALRIPRGERTAVFGIRGGVDIRVIIDSATGEIITGHPTNLLRHP